MADRNNKVIIIERIVNHFRSTTAFSNTEGITLMAPDLSKIIGCNKSQCVYHMRRLLEAGILIVKKGKFRAGNNKKNKPFLVLGEGYEQGESWRETLKIRAKQGLAIPKNEAKRARRGNLKLLHKKVLEYHTESLLRSEIEKALIDNNQLRKQLNDSLKQQSILEKRVAELQTEIDDLKTSEHQANVELIQAQREITTLTGRVLAEEKRQQRLDRQIAN